MSSVVVEETVFCKWLEVREFPIGQALGAWWSALPPVVEPSSDGQGLRVEYDDSLADLYMRLVEHVQQARKVARDRMRELGVAEEDMRESRSWDLAELSEFSRRAVQDNGLLTAHVLVLWCRERVPLPVFLDEAVPLFQLVEDVEFELCVARDDAWLSG